MASYGGYFGGSLQDTTTVSTTGVDYNYTMGPVYSPIVIEHEGESISRQAERKNAVNHYLLKARLRK